MCPTKPPLFFLNYNHGPDPALPLSQLQAKVDKRPIVSSLTHHALAVLVVFNAMMSQPFINCCGAIGPVWHNVGCWHHRLFS